MTKQNTEEIQIKGGLRPLSHDRSKDFTVGALFQLPKPETLPANFSLGIPVIEHQGDTDKCSAYATTSSSEFQEGVQLDPNYTFALTKFIEGNPDSWGASLRDAMSSHVKYGAVEKDVTTITSRKLAEYPEQLKSLALKHKKQTYLAVSSFGMDAFDSIRATIYKFREEKRAVVIGVEFGWPLSQPIMETLGSGGFGHALYVFGWRTINEKLYLLVANSYGKDAGENGVHYFSREVINEYADTYGAYMFVDKPREDVETMLSNGAKFDDSWVSVILKGLRAFIKELTYNPFITTDEKSQILNTIKLDNLIKELPEVPNPVVHSTAWCGGTLEERKAMYQLASRVCDEEKLFPSMKHDLLLTIYGESGFNQWCVNHKSKDYGLCQFSYKYYLVEYKMTPQEAIDNPEKCVRIMARNFKAGRQSNWVAFANRKKYVEHLKQLA